MHRGKAHLESYTAVPDCTVAYVCDVDSRAAEESAAWVERKTGKRPKVVTDFRRALEDPSLDAISIAMPNHWHAPAAILACQAGKHVYVEKPVSHNLLESAKLMAAATKAAAKGIVAAMRARMPGYLVPRLVREMVGESSKTLVL